MSVKKSTLSTIQRKVSCTLSFTDDDKEALGEDLDEIKSKLRLIEQRANSVRRDLRTLVYMAWTFIILTVVGYVLIFSVSNFGG